MVPENVQLIREQLSTAYPSGRVVPEHTETQHFYRDTKVNEVYPSVTTKTSLLSKAIYKQLAANQAVDYIIKHRGEDDVFEKARVAHVEALNQAGQWGTDAHDCVERYMRDWLETNKRPSEMSDFFTDTMDPESKSAALAASKFFDEYTLFPVATEMYVVSNKHKYAGTLDSLWMVGEKRAIGDTCKHAWAEKSRGRVKCLKCDKVESLQLMLGDWKSSNQVNGNYEYALQIGAYNQALVETTPVKPKVHWIIRLDKQKPHYEISVVRDIRSATKAFNAINEVYNFAKSKQSPIKPLLEKKIISL